MIKKIINLENLIYLIILALPLYLVKIKIYSVPTNWFEILVGLTLFFWIIKKSRLVNLKKFIKNYKKYIICVSLIFIGLLMATFLNREYAIGLGIIKSWFLIPIILMLIIVTTFPSKKMINVFITFYGSSFFVAGIALNYLISGKLTYDGRLEAFFNSPNYLAMYLAPALIIALVVVLKNKTREQKNNLILKSIMALSLVIILIVFYFTYSYAAWLSVILAVLATLLIEKKISLKEIFLIVVLFIFMFFSQWKSGKLNNLVTLNPRSSLASRIIIWRSAEKILENNWIFGIGPGNFQKVYLSYQKFYPPYLEWAVPHPHNLYLSFWLYGGLLSFLGFIGLLFFWFRDILVKIKTSHKAVLLITIGIMTITLVHGLVDTTYFKNDLAVIFWLNFLALKL